MSYTLIYCSWHERDYRWKHYTGFSIYDNCLIKLKSKGETLVCKMSLTAQSYKWVSMRGMQWEGLLTYNYQKGLEIWAQKLVIADSNLYVEKSESAQHNIFPLLSIGWCLMAHFLSLMKSFSIRFPRFQWQLSQLHLLLRITRLRVFSYCADNEWSTRYLELFKSVSNSENKT